MAIDVDYRQLRKKMQRYEQLCGKEVKQLLHNASRVCCVELAKMTFPTEKKHGEKAIGKDFVKVFLPLNPDTFKKVDRLKPGQEMRNNVTGAVFATGDQPKIKDFQEAIAFHRYHRNKRNGHVTSLKITERAILRRTMFNKLLKFRQQNVGYAKGGWASAAQMCKADVRMPLRGIQPFAKRHAKRNNARVTDKKTGGLGWTAYLTNRVNFTDKILKPQYEQIAVQNGLRAYRSMLNHAIRYEMAKRAGLKA